MERIIYYIWIYDILNILYKYILFESVIWNNGLSISICVLNSKSCFTICTLWMNLISFELFIEFCSFLLKKIIHHISTFTFIFILIKILKNALHDLQYYNSVRTESRN